MLKEFGVAKRSQVLGIDISSTTVKLLELVKVEKVPFLGDIPYLGKLFKSTANTQQKTETLIFITPRILSEALVN